MIFIRALLTLANICRMVVNIPLLRFRINRRRRRLASKIRQHYGEAVNGLPDEVLIAYVTVRGAKAMRDHGVEPSSFELDVVRKSKREIAVWEGNP